MTNGAVPKFGPKKTLFNQALALSGVSFTEVLYISPVWQCQGAGQKQFPTQQLTVLLSSFFFFSPFFFTKEDTNPFHWWISRSLGREFFRENQRLSIKSLILLSCTFMGSFSPGQTRLKILTALNCIVSHFILPSLATTSVTTEKTDSSIISLRLRPPLWSTVWC